MSYRSNWGRTHHEPIVNRDPGDETLFDADELAPKTCSCGVTRPNLCPVDADLRWAAEAPGRRPKDCLRRIDPATSEWPAGY